MGECYIVDENLYTWNTINKLWHEVGRIKGDKGDVGPQGIPGHKGEMGPQGPRGIQGIQGVMGIPGEKGEPGEIGPTGPRGEAGPRGEIGPRGIQGEVGPAGDKGERGEQGLPGTSVTILGTYNSLDELKRAHAKGEKGDSYLINTNLYVWSDEDSNWKNVGEIKGPKGDRGDVGPRGEEGPIGPKGDIGPQGPIGIQGSVGPRGEQGEAGPPGKDGKEGISSYAGLYDDDTNTISANKTVPTTFTIKNQMPSLNMTYSNNTINVQDTGVYEIYYKAKVSSTSNDTITITIQDNVKQVPGTVNKVDLKNNEPITISATSFYNINTPNNIRLTITSTNEELLIVNVSNIILTIKKLNNINV